MAAEKKALEDIRTFPVVVDHPLMKYVYPLMQRDVMHIMETLQKDDVTLILFGSSITMHCNVYSDIDIAVRTEKLDPELFMRLRKTISLAAECDVDVIYYNELTTERIKEEIDRGLVLKRGSFECAF